MCSRIRSRSGRRSGFQPLGIGVERGAACPRVAVDDRELDLGLVGVEVEEELVHLVHDRLDAGVGAVDLVDDEDHREPRLERLAQHEARLRQRTLARVDEEEHAVDHRDPALHLAAEVGMAGRVDDVDLRLPVAHAVFFARIVMPFSRSRSPVSRTRSATSWFARNAPDCHRSASTSVVFPWSTCATIATLRMSERLGMLRAYRPTLRPSRPSRDAQPVRRSGRPFPARLGRRG